MRETVGLRTIAPIIFPELLKRDALLFKRIGVLGCQEAADAELQWLIEQGIVFDPQLSTLNEAALLDKETTRLLIACKELAERSKREVGQYVDNLEEEALQDLKLDSHEKVRQVKKYVTFMTVSDMLLRPFSAYYRNNKNIDTYPLFYIRHPELAQQTASVGDVIEITVNHLPIPDDTTSWEQIMDFRNDPDTEGKFLGLRNWMNDTARAKLTPIEVEQKLEWLLHEYQQHMELHRMKTNASALETIIVSAAEIAENLVKLQFGKLAKGLFSLRHRKVALLEGELKSPGREIAFISKAQETFR